MPVYYVILLNSSDRNNAVYDLVLKTRKRFNTLFRLLVLRSIEVSYTYIGRYLYSVVDLSLNILHIRLLI